MKKNEIKVGGHYRASVSGKLTTVRVNRIMNQTSWNGKAATTYAVTNLSTGRELKFRSAAKFRNEVGMEPTTVPKKLREAAESAAEFVAQKPEGEQRPDPTPALTVPTGGTGSAATTSTTCPAAPSTASTAAASANGLGGRLAALTRPATLSVPHVEVRALAGTGKTTTAVEGMAKAKGVLPSVEPSEQQRAVWDQIDAGRHETIRFAAFGKAIATELQHKLDSRGLSRLGCEASTFHSMGVKAVNRALGRFALNQFVVQDHLGELLGRDVRDVRREPGGATFVSAVDDLVSLCKQNLAEPTEENLDRLSRHYDVEMDGQRSRVFEHVPRVLEMCKAPRTAITFDDMVWLPVVLDLPVPRADLLIVDEAQDLNRMQQELALKAGRRVVYVGDRHQAIFGFAGADAESMDRLGGFLRDSGGLVELPLTVTRRCGRRIVEEARRWVPEYEAHPDNSDGEVRRAAYLGKKRKFGEDGPEVRWEDSYAAKVRPGDMVLCRANAPLVNQVFKFIRRGVKANIIGRDVARGLTALVDKLGKDSPTVPAFVGKLGDWLAAETAKESAKRNPSETRIQGFEDRHDCLMCFADGAATVADVRAKIDSVFTDDRNCPGVRFSSIHRAKGLEADTVHYVTGFELPDEKLQPWERVQARNLRYVAITRAKKELVYV